MKPSQVVTGAFVASVTAQSYPSGFPNCGIICVSNLVALAPNFDCASTDYACLCQRANFQYGVRDCANEACPNAGDAQTVITYAVNQCASAGVALPDTSASATGSTTFSPTTTAEFTGITGGASSTPVSTSFAVGTDDSGSTTTSSSVIVGGGVVGGGGSNGGSSSELDTVVIDTATTTDTALISSTDSSGAGQSTGTTGSTGSSSAFAPQHTAAPAGIIAAAGIGLAIML
ncbi:hypothetical protein SCAR479_13154 [Seiridium cardinale]|uniref:CFEM domain-containing protein n=1 Tax=Seiridium cardinale TaxID=138064 RepID=A0ABR2X8U2_9PEZI